MTLSIANRLFFLTVALFIVCNSTLVVAQKRLPDQLIATCSHDPKMQEARSKELAELLASDQKDREFSMDHITINDVNNELKNDLARRKRVGEIMAEGCLKTASDYVAASLIYQHGDVPDHYYQAFVWANRAVALEDIQEKKLVAMTLDRYLVSIGKKQLFGSQFYAKNIMKDGCFCLQPVERSFPDALRIEYVGKKLLEQFNELPKLNDKKKNCPIAECPTKLLPTPRGSIIGFW